MFCTFIRVHSSSILWFSTDFCCKNHWNHRTLRPDIKHQDDMRYCDSECKLSVRKRALGSEEIKTALYCFCEMPLSPECCDNYAVSWHRKGSILLCIHHHKFKIIGKCWGHEEGRKSSFFLAGYCLVGPVQYNIYPGAFTLLGRISNNYMHFIEIE